MEAIPGALPHLTNFNFDLGLVFLIPSLHVCHTHRAKPGLSSPTVPDFRDIYVLLHPEWTLRDTFTPLLPSRASCSPAHTVTPTPTLPAATSTRDTDPLLDSHPIHTVHTQTGKPSPREGLGRSWRSQDRLSRSGTEHSQAN